jgi:hypothetical protein
VGTSGSAVRDSWSYGNQKTLRLPRLPWRLARAGTQMWADPRSGYAAGPTIDSLFRTRLASDREPVLLRVGQIERGHGYHQGRCRHRWRGCGRRCGRRRLRRCGRRCGRRRLRRVVLFSHFFLSIMWGRLVSTSRMDRQSVTKLGTETGAGAVAGVAGDDVGAAGAGVGASGSSAIGVNPWRREQAGPVWRSAVAALKRVFVTRAGALAAAPPVSVAEC